MKAIVTGGAGFIGSHIAHELESVGHEAIVVDDLSTGHRDNLPERARLVEADITDNVLLERVFDRHKPDIVFHHAAQTSVARSVEAPLFDCHSNILGTINVVQAAVRHGVKRFIFASTGGAIYGEVSEGEAGLGTPPDPRSPYACSKLAGEAYVSCFAQGKMGYNILRYANVYGPRQDPHGEAGVVAIFAERILSGKPIKINARNRISDPMALGCVRDYVYVDDVVRVNMMAAAGRLDRVLVNVSTGIGSTTRDIALAIGEAAGIQPRMSAGSYREGDLERSVLEPWIKPRTALAGGILKTVEWFLANKK